MGISSNMKIYSEAYNAAGQQILGNLDGQFVWDTKNYKRTKHYKRLINLPSEKLSLNGRVKTYLIKCGDVLIETINK